MNEKVKLDKKAVFCFNMESLVKSLQGSDLSENEKNLVLMFLTSNHCKDDLFYFAGGPQ